jgi:fructokinase
MSRYDVYGMGAALVDTEIEVDDAFLATARIDKGVMTLVDEPRQDELLTLLEGHLVASRRASGGSAANTVIATRHFGGTAFYSCRVADDENGRFYLADMNRAGVDTHVNAGRNGNGVTGKCLVMITPDAERTMNTFLGISSTLDHDDLDPAAIADSKYVYIEGYLVTSPSARAAAVRARELAEKAGVRTALSFSDPGIVAHFRDGLAEMLGGGVDMVFCNGAEAREWSGAERIEDAAESLRDIAKSFAITLGAEGALVFDGRQYHRIAPHPVRALDTNGAGDMFAGAYLYAITQGHDAQFAGSLACRAAAELVTHFGPRLPGPAHAKILQEFHAAR